MHTDALMPRGARYWLRSCVLLLILTVTMPAFSQQPADPADPVEKLSAALWTKFQPRELDAGLAFRKELITKHAADLRSTDELGRALLLKGWYVNYGSPVNAVDLAVRAEIASRFRKAVEAELRGGNPAAQRTTATFVGELASTAQDGGQIAEFAREQLSELAPALAKLTENKNPETVAVAARALGKIQPEPIIAVPVLQRLFSIEDVKVRRAAAGALSEMIQVAIKHDSSRTRTEPLRIFPPTAQFVIPAAAAGLANADGYVRLRCLEAIRDTARAMADDVRGPYGPNAFPPPGKPLTEDERAEIKRAIAYAKAIQARTQPLQAAFTKQTPALIKSLAHADPATSAAAADALEAIGSTRQRALRLYASVSNLDLVVKLEPETDALGDALRPAAPALAKNLAHKEERLQLASLYALETLSDLATPAIPQLVKALSDANAYVRWGAVRVLGRMAPEGAEQAVPGLTLLVKDKNEYVRTTTLLVLARYGPGAKAAVPALRESAGDSDARFRVLAIRALEAAGPASAPAVPELVKALTAAEAEVRLASACALAKLGPLAAPAAAALRQALNDPNAAVRLAASRTLLLMK